MQIGCLGGLVFEVSDTTIKTIKNATWNGSVSLQNHARHLNYALTEFVGIDADSFTFTITLSRYLGADVEEELDKLLGYEKSGKALKLVIGTRLYGSYRWLIKKHKISMQHFDKQGNLASTDVELTLVEYVRR